jgi:hypothetical protein
MLNWMITLKSVCDVCLGVPSSYHLIGKRKVAVVCNACKGKGHFEKTITLSDLVNIITDIQDGYTVSEITNVINNIKDGY